MLAVEVGRGLSDENGDFGIALNQTVLGRININADALAFGAQSVIAESGEAGSEVIANVLLQPVHVIAEFDPSEDVAINAGDIPVVTLGANSLTGPEGTSIVGNVTAELTVIDPSSDPGVMPGDFQAINLADNSIMPIESYGAFNVTFRDDAGSRLQLSAGSDAEVRIPLASAKVPAQSPSTIPLYYFDIERGFWVEEGEAVLTEVATGAWAYVGTVEHFSTWNADQVYQTSFINGCVENEEGARISGAQIEAQGQDYIGVSSSVTGSGGEFRIAVKSDSGVLLRARRSGQSNTLSARSLSVGQELTLDTCVIIGSAAITVTLTWGEQPSDLDSPCSGLMVLAVSFIFITAMSRWRWKA